MPTAEVLFSLCGRFIFYTAKRKAKKTTAGGIKRGIIFLKTTIWDKKGANRHSATQHTEILTFEEAQTPQKAPFTTAKNGFYIPDFTPNTVTYWVPPAKKPLITIGINPSTAEPDNLDNTLKSVERIALFNGFDSFIMFNVYAQRATNPDHMDKAFNRALHEENMNAFRWVLFAQRRRARHLGGMGHDCGKARLSQNLPCGHDGHRQRIPCKVVSGRQAL